MLNFGWYACSFQCILEFLDQWRSLQKLHSCNDAVFVLMSMLFLSEIILVSTKMMNRSGMGRVLTGAHVHLSLMFSQVLVLWGLWGSPVFLCELPEFYLHCVLSLCFFSGIKQRFEKRSVWQRCRKNLGQWRHENAELLTCKCKFMIREQ